MGTSRISNVNLSPLIPELIAFFDNAIASDTLQDCIYRIPSRFHSLTATALYAALQVVTEGIFNDPAKSGDPNTFQAAIYLQRMLANFGGHHHVCERSRFKAGVLDANFVTIGDVLRMMNDLPDATHGAPDGTTLN